MDITLRTALILAAFSFGAAACNGGDDETDMADTDMAEETDMAAETDAAE